VLSDLADTTLHGVETQDAKVVFRDTFTTSTVSTTLAIDLDAPGRANYATGVPMRYAAASWNPSEIEQIDGGLAWLHEQVGSTALLKDSAGRNTVISRYGEYIPWSLTDANRDGRTDANGMIVEEARAANNFSAGAWNLGSGGLAFTAAGIRGGTDYLTKTAIHELAHNWDAESVFWGMWLDLSGWEPSNGRSTPPPGKVPSGDGAWFHNANAKFAEDYGKWSPSEDWTTTFEAYFEYTRGTLSANKAADLADKFEFIEAFLESKRS
jgi:hypothetical protein